ncbi:aldo/keto reductase [Cyanobium sp. CH-040]|uniref:aldo/keto reductase n=1 Tax=Cyanobium sp. CH-040 TaxID=2823708 RepID=UPI0020CF809E|nr:aldo/keto reductase [Cyanobium sp. CH-040]MCP9927031.1 aldo/keto reductase [Cyanobium sp. CH-040]
MKYHLLGRSGLRVSELGLGCGTIGTNWGPLGSDRTESFKILEGFAAAGGNFLDTSNRYQESQSEQWLGEFVRSDRDRFVIGTKFSLGDGASDFNGLGKATNQADPNNRGNHRKNLRRSVEGSLRRLQTDYIDLLWLHIWDYTTPVDELVQSINDLIQSGKILYAGLSSVPAWEVARLNAYADFHALSPFIALQNEWSLVERSQEPEYVPMCKALDLGIVSWSPLGGGIVSGKYNRKPLPQGMPHRLVPHVEDQSQFWYPCTQRNLSIIEQLLPRFDQIGEPPTAIALRWLMQQEELVTIPIFSVRTYDQLQEALRASEFELSKQDMDFIELKTRPAIAPPLPEYGPYPYPMLEYGSPALPSFYSRALLYGETESMIVNHRNSKAYKYHP